MKFWILQNTLQNVLFSFTNLSQGNFLYHPKFFIPTQVLHTACTPTELKQNLLHWPFFASFVKLLNIRLDECSLFLSHLKSVFLIVIGREQNYTSASLQENHKQIISCNRKCPWAQIQIWRRTKVCLTTDLQVDSFFTVNCLRLCFGPLLLLQA